MRKAKIGRFKWQRRIWFILAFLALLWLLYGFSATGAAVESNMQSEQAQSSAYQLGTALGASLSSGFFLCTSLPFLLFFMFMGWRNGVAIRNAKQHAETLSALEQKR